MLFNSLDFAIFLPVVFTLYWFVFRKGLKRQNLLIIVASYIFYGWWDWRFLSLIVISTLVDYTIGRLLQSSESKQNRKFLLWVSILVNLGFLGFFKYFNFFLENFKSSFSILGVQIDDLALNIILPVGISFYTFQTLSYTIDVYKRKLKATDDFLAFTAFVSFFPQLVAGPIERASNLLPQFVMKRQFDYALAVNGLRQILWGFFKKLVIADNCAEFANHIFAGADDYNGSTLLFGALVFSVQIYCDFSGYSDIAIGTSRLFGFSLMKNFAFPYFSRDIAEFWRRWHISLSTWFRDYLYIPLGGSKGSKGQQVRNVFIVFIVSGFWHGANWTFIIWGALNALYFLPLLLSNRNRTYLGQISENRLLPSAREALNMAITFLLTVMAWIAFRAENIDHMFTYYSGIFSADLLSKPEYPSAKDAFRLLGLILFFIVIEWQGRNAEFAIERFLKKSIKPIRLAFYMFIIVLIGLFLQTNETPFIYFQF